MRWPCYISPCAFSICMKILDGIEGLQWYRIFLFDFSLAHCIFPTQHSSMKTKRWHQQRKSFEVFHSFPLLPFSKNSLFLPILFSYLEICEGPSSASNIFQTKITQQLAHQHIKHQIENLQNNPFPITELTNGTEISGRCGWNGKKEYIWEFPSFPATFQGNELYH